MTAKEHIIYIDMSQLSTYRIESGLPSTPPGILVPLYKRKLYWTKFSTHTHRLSKSCGRESRAYVHEYTRGEA